MLKVVPPIDLIALDLDGTLLNSAEQISAANRTAIRAALAAGIRVVLVTGRGADTPAEFARELGLNLPVICAHGALTIDFLSGRVLGHIPVPLQYAVPMIEFAEAQGLDAAVYVDERFHRIEGTHRYMSDMTGPGWVDVASFAHILSAAPTFIRFLGRDAVRAISERFGELPVHFKHEVWGDFEELAVTSADATKKNALSRLCDDLKIPASHVLAVGDSRNDLPMLRWAGIGVVMANASPEVRAGVEHQTASNDQDGVARAIERFALSGADEEQKTA